MKQAKFQHSLLDEVSLAKLRSSGINSVKSFLNENDDQLIKLSNLSKNDITIIKDCFRTIYETYLHVSRDEYQDIIQKNFQENRVYQTGITAIDERLKGLTLGSIVELVGSPEAGKTLLCTTLSINLLAKYGLECYWIDTKMDFSPIGAERQMRQKYERKDLMINAMKKIHVQRGFTIEDVVEALEHLLENEKIESGLLILDSLSAVMCECVGDRTKVGEKCLKKIIHNVRNLCVKKKFIALITVLPKKENPLPKPRPLTRCVSSTPDDGWNGTIESLFQECSSERIIMTRTETNMLKLQNIDVRNSNKRHLYVTKSFSDKNVIGKDPIQVSLTDEGVV